MTPEHQLTVIGPSNSGKTTYFAALYFLLKNSDSRYEFRLDRTIDIHDKTYLSEISEEWANLRQIKHTDSNVWESLELPLISRDNTERIRISIPDIAGEYCTNALTSRKWDERIATQLECSDGFLLFINVNDLRAVELMDANWAARIKQSGKTNKNKRPAEDWEPDHELLPSDVLYTDLIQQVHFHNMSKIYRVSVVLSAWDIVQPEASKRDPETFFVKRFPLLAQFFASHAERFIVEIFGVSAYGAQPKDKTAVKDLEDKDPHERVQVVHSSAQGHDITLPLLHLIRHV